MPIATAEKTRIWAKLKEVAVNYRHLIAIPSICLALLNGGAFFASRSISLQRLVDTELMHLLAGGSCKGENEDTLACSHPLSPMCSGSGPYTRKTWTNAVKRSCDSAGTSKVCDCNQSGVPGSDCTTVATCSGAGCTSCGSETSWTQVRSTVHLNGEPCNDDNGCT